MWIDLMQWPAMAITVLAAWFTGCKTPRQRMIGFWCFCLSNVLWVIWGLHASAWALIVLQVLLAGMNIRGYCKNRRLKRAQAD
ncbi:amino acid transporter [Pseudomonas sp. Leaf127]|nr:amino acid transporter [Pseudomonas sp. Leaf127]